MESSSLLLLLSSASFSGWFGAQWDFLVFIFLCVAAGLIIDGWLCRSAKAREIPVDRKALAGMWGVLIVVLLAGWFAADVSGDRQDRALRSLIGGFGPTYAEELIEMGHAAIDENTSPDDPAYLAMIEKQVRWLDLNPTVADIYTFRKHPDGNALIVDSETDYDRNGVFEGDRESRTEIGEVWEEKNERIEAAYSGVPGFDEEPYTDRWGTWVSSYVPMLDGAGNVEAVLGVDYPAEEWLRTIRRARLRVIGFLGLLVTAVLAAGAIISVLRASLVERRRSERELRAAKEKADAAKEKANAANEALATSNRDLERFGYVTSHDLQEPLRMVTGFLQLVQKKAGPELGKEVGEYIRHAVDGADRMRRMINGLLELSRLKRNTDYFKTVDAGKALVVALDNLSVAIKESGAKINRSPLPLVQGDETQLIQLFQNLVSNAIKFCQKETPEIDISAREVQQDDATWWVFSVRDNGPGIDPKDHDRIYEIFQRLQPTGQGEGTGIGLALCRKIVENHGGEITVESAEGQGSVFKFNLRAAVESSKDESKI